jgi:DNA-directed RNA polymerase specialized sigma24 family protein
MRAHVFATEPVREVYIHRSSMSPEDFARFLESLSPDREEAGHRYIRLHKKLVGFFGMKGISDSMSAADETLRRTAEKIVGGANVPEVENYCLGIARNVTKEWWRREQREDVVFRRFTESLADESSEEVERIERILKPCLERLEDVDRDLLLEYCRVPEGLSRAEHRRRLADKLQTTMLALRIRVSRLRAKLTDCVEGRSGNR